MASRAQLVEREIRPALDARATSCSSIGSFLSTYAYQGVGRGLARGGAARGERDGDGWAGARSHAAADAAGRTKGWRARCSAAGTIGWSAPSSPFTSAWRARSRRSPRRSGRTRIRSVGRSCWSTPSGAQTTVFARVLDCAARSVARDFPSYGTSNAITRTVAPGSSVELRARLGRLARRARAGRRRAPRARRTRAHVRPGATSTSRATYVDTLADSTLYHARRRRAGRRAARSAQHYLSPQLLARLSERTTGRYAGVGAQIDVRDGWITIVAPLPGGPAIEAGHPDRRSHHRRSTASRCAACRSTKRRRRCAARRDRWCG